MPKMCAIPQLVSAPLNPIPKQNILFQEEPPTMWAQLRTTHIYEWGYLKVNIFLNSKNDRWLKLFHLKVQLIQDHNFGTLFVSEWIQIAFKSFSLQCCNFYLEIVPWINASVNSSCVPPFYALMLHFTYFMLHEISILMLYFSTLMRFSTLITFFYGGFKLISSKCS